MRGFSGRRPILAERSNGPLFRICRAVLRTVTRRYRVECTDAGSGPEVHIVHHRDLRGPLACMTWMEGRVRPWVLDVFCDRGFCFRHYRDYTLTVRFGMPKALAAAIAYPYSGLVAALMRSMGAIRVFRGSRRILETFRASTDALVAGDSLLVCPDVDITDAGPTLGAIHEGFLELERYYWRTTSRHLSFVPRFVDDRTGCIHAGEVVRFERGGDFRMEKPEVLSRLKAEFVRLERLHARPDGMQERGCG